MIDIRETADFFTAFILLTFVCLMVAQRHGKLIALTAMYFFGSGLWIFMNPIQIYGKYQVPVSYLSAQAWVLGFLIFLFVAFSKFWRIQVAFNFLKYFSVINAITATVIPPPYNGGVFFGDTFDVTFATLFTPYFIEGIYEKRKIDLWSLILVTGCAIAVGSITPFIILATTSLWYIIKSVRVKYTALGLTGIASLVASHFYLKHEPAHLTDRTHVWGKVMSEFFHHFNWVLGTGTGTYRLIGPMLQGDSENVFYFLHSEPLQILFENGVIGLILACAVYLRRRCKNAALDATFLGLTLCSTVQYPLRVGVGFLFVLLLIRMDKELWLDDVYKEGLIS